MKIILMICIINEFFLEKWEKNGEAFFKCLTGKKKKKRKCKCGVFKDLREYLKGKLKNEVI